MLVMKVAIHSRPVMVASLRSDHSDGRANVEDAFGVDADMTTPLGRRGGPPATDGGGGRAGGGTAGPPRRFPGRGASRPYSPRTALATSTRTAPRRVVLRSASAPAEQARAPATGLRADLLVAPGRQRHSGRDVAFDVGEAVIGAGGRHGSSVPARRGRADAAAPPLPGRSRDLGGADLRRRGGDRTHAARGSPPVGGAGAPPRCGPTERRRARAAVRRRPPAPRRPRGRRPGWGRGPSPRAACRQAGGPRRGSAGPRS